MEPPPPGTGGLTCVGSEEGEEEKNPGHGGDADSDPEAVVWVLGWPESLYITQVHMGAEVVHSNEPLSSVCSWPPCPRSSQVRRRKGRRCVNQGAEGPGS